MNILLTGASGFIGRNITTALTATGHQVKPVSRSHGIDFSRMLTAGDWLPHLTGIDTVINTVGIIGESGSQRFETLHTQAPVALFQACSEARVRQVIQISALGADEAAFSAYHLSKRAADNALRNLDLDWFVLRPSLVYGHGGTSANLFMRLASLPLIPVIGDGKQKLQPVHISDVVATVMCCLTSGESKQTLDIAGAQTVTFAEWLQMMRKARGLPRAPLLRIPFAFAEVLVQMGSHFNPLLRVENLRMLQTSCSANIQPLAQFLGRMPLIAEPHLFFSDALTTGSSL